MMNRVDLIQSASMLVHYAKARPDQVKAFLQSLADDDVRHGIREIPGFDIIEERMVA